MIRSLQGLRGFAAVAVLLFHLVPYFDISTSSLFPSWIFKYGFSGVDLFFVLSGFVLTHTYAAKDQAGVGFSNYFLRRVVRIYSGYWPFLLCAYVIGTYWSFPRMADDSLLHSIFLTSTDLKELVLPISWSLTFELYFYLLFGLAFFVSRKTVIALVCAYTLSVIVLGFFYPDISSLPGFLFSPFALEFLLGCGLAILPTQNSGRMVAILAFILSIVLYVLGAQLDAIEGLVRTFTFGLGGALLMFALLNTEAAWSTWPFKPLVALGNASYTLYLCHVIFIDVAQLNGYWHYLSTLTPLLAEVGNVAFIALVLLFSIGFYEAIEKPLYRRLTSGFTN